MRNSLIPGVLALLWLCAPARAQSLTSGFMAGKERGAIALSWTSERYDEAFLVPLDAGEIPVFDRIEVNSISLFAIYGVSPRMDFVFNLPFIMARGHASQHTLDELGYENRQAGLQDAAVAVKYKVHSWRTRSCRLDLLAAAGIKTPVGNYKTDRGLRSIVAIGNRSTNLNGTGILHFATPRGVYATAQGSYSYRTSHTPDAYTGEIKIGYGNSKFHATAWYAKQISIGGVDVLGEGFNGNFSATDVSYTRAGLNLFVPFVSGIGFSTGINRYISGRNVGKAMGISGSVVYTY